MTAKRKTPKRLTRDSDRAYARELVRLYQTKESCGGLIGTGGPTVSSFVDGDWLAMELQHFADFGTWDETAEARAARAASMRGWYAGAVESVERANKWTTKRAVAEVARARGVSVQIVLDALYGRKPKRSM